jgi:hypothetical protein
LKNGVTWWDFEISCDTYIPVYYHVSLERFIRFAQKNGCNIYLKPLGDECGRNIYSNKCNTCGNLLTEDPVQNMFLYGTWFSINDICMQYSSIWSSYVSHKPVSLQVEMNLVVLSIGLHIIQNSFLRPSGTFKCSHTQVISGSSVNRFPHVLHLLL